MTSHPPIEVLQAHDGELVSLSRQGERVDLTFRDFTFYSARPDGRFDEARCEFRLVIDGVESLRRTIDDWREEFVMEVLIDDHPLDEYRWSSIRGANMKAMEIGFAMGSILIQGKLSIPTAEIKRSSSSGVAVPGGNHWGERSL